MNDEICAPFERPLAKDRRREGVVDDGQRAGGPGEARDRSDVDHPQFGVGGGLEEDEPRPANIPPDGFEILEVEELRFYAEFLQAARQQREGVSIQNLVGDDAVAYLQQRPERRADRRHSQSDDEGGLAAFEVGDTLL